MNAKLAHEAQAAAGVSTPGPALAWGNGSDGELGNGTTNGATTPVQVSLPQGVTLSQVSAGATHDVGLTSTGEVLAWGDNSDGELGNGSTTSSNKPVQVSMPQGVTVTQVAAAGGFSLALTSTGQVYAWGDNAYGELGDGSSVQSSNTPVQVALPAGTTVTQVAAGGGLAAGGGFALALTSSGQVLAWGENNFGQLGNGSTTNENTPVDVSLPSGASASEVSAGGYFSLAMTSSGQALAWGGGFGGVLGNGSTSSSDTPVQVQLPSETMLTQVSAGGTFVLALTSSGQALAWGGGGDGQLGNGSTSSSDTPVQVQLPSGTTLTQVSAGGTFGLALTSKAGALSWGDNTSGELGNDSTTNTDTPGAVSLPSGTSLASLSAGSDFVAAIVFVPATVSSIYPSTGPSYGGTSVTIAGNGFNGTTAVHFGTKPATSYKVTSNTSITATSPAGSGTVGVTVTGPGGTSSTVPADRFSYIATGSAVDWGYGANGQLGNGTTDSSSAPIAPSLPAGTKITATATEADASLALTTTGKVYAWGDNTYGGLGNGTTTATDKPVQVKLPSGTTATAIAGEDQGGLALTSTGQVYAWGYGADGELGDGKTTNSDTPVKVKLPSGTTATAIAGEESGGLALTSTGQVYAWGYGPDGELGDGKTTNSDTPVKVKLPSGTTATAIAGEESDGLALTSTGKVYAWGNDTEGNLGNGTTTESDTPVQVKLPSGTTATAIAGEDDSGLALTSSNQVLAWGFNTFGELGDGSYTMSTIPVRVSLPPGTTVTALAAEGDGGLAITSTGAVLAWGYNADGELGNGTISSPGSDVPVTVALPPGVVATNLSRGIGDQAVAVVHAAPIVSGITPTVGVAGGGTKVTVSGMGFSGATAVHFGTKAASGFSVTSPTTITATSPAGSGPVDVTVTGANGTSPRVQADIFTYLATGSGLDWGDNIYGEVGNGNIAASVVDTPVAPFLPAGTKVAAGAEESYGSLALTSTGKVYAWGHNADGELGNGTTSDSSVPVRVKLPSGTTATAIAGEADSGLALTSTGKVYAWGYGFNGELGDGNTTDSSRPVLVKLPSGTTATAIAGEADSGLTLTSTGKVYAWGDNGHGELGDGTTTGSDTPVQVKLPTSTPITAIAAEGYGGLALTSKGKVLSWGYNYYGELGNGTTSVNSDLPVSVSLPSGTVVTAIAGEFSAGLALTSTGKVLSWGYNGYGELGNGTTTNSDTPVSVSLPSGATATALGSESDTGLALLSGGSVLAWGYGQYGELGNGTTTASDKPVSVSLPAGVTVSSLGQGIGDTGIAIVGRRSLRGRPQTRRPTPPRTRSTRTRRMPRGTPRAEPVHGGSQAPRVSPGPSRPAAAPTRR